MKVLFSNKLTLVLLLVFAFAMAYGTFLENDFGTEAVRSVIYNAWWFELIMVLLGVNFVGNIFKYNLLRKDKAALLCFHLSFIIIILGAMITRYTGYEAMLHLREGESTNQIVSSDNYLSVYKNGVLLDEERLNVSVLKMPDISFDLGNDQTLSCNRYVPHAGQYLKDAIDGSEFLEIVVAGTSGRRDLYLKRGEYLLVGGHKIGFDYADASFVNISAQDKGYMIQSNESLSYFIMDSKMTGNLRKDTTVNLRFRTLYQHEGFSFVVKQVHEKKTIAYQPILDKEKAKTASNLLFVKLQGQEEQNEILAFQQGVYSEPKTVTFEGEEYELHFGAKKIEIPFTIQLLDFQLERYPGSTSPSSYASEVQVMDGTQSFPYRIYMNNVLDFKGFRFFQASYDTDEGGSVLSVNQDFWGTNITYLGYALMIIGMLLSVFPKTSRFQSLIKKLNALPVVLPFVLFLGVTFLANGQSIIINKEQANNFSELLVQDMDGRIKPLNSLASELLRKIHRGSSYEINEEGIKTPLDYNQVFLSINMFPQNWKREPIIKIDANKGREILELIGQPLGTKYLSFVDLLGENDSYLLDAWVTEANRKKPAERSNLDKELIAVDERFNIVFQAISGHYLKIFPRSDSPGSPWSNDANASEGYSQEDLMFVKNILPQYYQALFNSRASNDYGKAEELLSYIALFQNVVAKSVIPSDARRAAEIKYNKWAIFNRLFPAYWLVGILLVALAVWRVLEKNLVNLWVNRIGTYLLILFFIAHTFNILLRWYVAGFPPWSNGYEMMILVSWFIVGFGISFCKKSDFVLPLAALFSGTLLFVSYLDWLNPEITNLVPVLKSYWLKIHVAIIVGSYAPLALSALLGLMSLFLIIFNREKRFDKTLVELSCINELSMTIGVYMLGTGTFLGGVWANESWGRYWGWDPKETWALISLMVYVFVLHLRLVPSLRGVFTFNFNSVIAFFSIIMTSYGVNYYLTGLHSYAKGDPIPVPQFIYWVVLGIAIVSIIAFLSNKKREKQN